MRVRFAIVEATKLRPHERVDANLLLRLTEHIQEDGFLQRPLLVAEGYYVILDGHHRYHALLALGCTHVPVYFVDYTTDDITVTVWPESGLKGVTKQEVIARAGKTPFPPKTTRHLLMEPLPDKPVPLKELRPASLAVPPRTPSSEAVSAAATPREPPRAPRRSPPKRRATKGKRRGAAASRPRARTSAGRGGSRRPRSR